MKRISVLGSTGSIGTQAISVIEQSKGEFVCECICADSNAKELAAQAMKLRPRLVGITNSTKYGELKENLGYSPEIVVGDDAAQLCAKCDSADVVVNGISGMSGFLPLVSAIETGKIIAAANKESIICAHSVLDALKTDNSLPLVAPFANGARIIPVDSEQSAIFQCIEDNENVESIILTASGGAFRDLTKAELERVTVSDALCHPTWSMGKKITVDSASMFNKGLEIMEASYLFGFDGSQIEVLIHRQSIVHSLVRFKDASVKAQLSLPDMRGAIQYAITYPKRQKSPVQHIDLTAQAITFETPDSDKYPAIELAYEALKEGRVLPIVYNAANEVAADAFISGKCKFTDIGKIVAYAMKKADTGVKALGVCDIIEVDKCARVFAQERIK